MLTLFGLFDIYIELHMELHNYEDLLEYPSAPN